MGNTPEFFKLLSQIFDKKTPPAENQRRLLLYPANQATKLGLGGAAIFGYMGNAAGAYFCLGTAFVIIILVAILVFYLIKHKPNNFDGPADLVGKKGADENTARVYKEIVEIRDKSNEQAKSIYVEENSSITIEPSPKVQKRSRLNKGDSSYYSKCSFIFLIPQNTSPVNNWRKVEINREVACIELNENDPIVDKLGANYFTQKYTHFSSN